MLQNARAQLIDGHTRLMGLLGQGIAYTLSPRLHNGAAAALGHNVAYLPIDLPTAEVAAFLRLAWTLQAVGFNVTKPHKQLVAGVVPQAGLQSVNTLYRGPDGWLAASTDGGGFARGLERLGQPLAAFKHVVLLGAGGVTAAILAHMAAGLLQLPAVTIARRSSARDGAAAGLWPQPLKFIAWTAAALANELRGSGEDTLLIQASSAPQHGDDLSFLLPAIATFRGTFCDLVYASPSALLPAAAAKGLPTQDGTAMLIEQARLSQELWWGEAASYEAMAGFLAT